VRDWGHRARRMARLIARGALAGALLLFVLGSLESLVLFLKRPEPWTLDLFGRLVWSPILYGALGVVPGCLSGLVAGALLGIRRRPASRSAEASAVWAVALPSFLAFYWVFAVSLLSPSGRSSPQTAALTCLALLGAVGLAVLLWRRAAREELPLRSRARWTAALILVLWVPLYVPAARPSFEYTRTSRPPADALEPPSDLNVLFIMLDTVRADCLGCYGSPDRRTPNIDRLAGGSALFEIAVTPEAKTRPAVASMFTGLYPRTHGVDTNSKTLGEEFASLPEILRSHGYETVGFTAAGVLSGYFGTARGFDYYAESPRPWFRLRNDCAVFRVSKRFRYWPELMNGTRAWVMNERVTMWLRRDHRRPFFAFVHYFDAHAPYWPPEEYDFAAAEGLAGVRPPSPDRAEIVAPDYEMPRDFLRREWLRYQGEIACVDQRVGELLNVLEEIGEADRTIVVLVADHGESFEHGVYFSHGVRVYDPEIHVPLLIRDPRDPRPRRLRGQVRLIDLFPTVLALVGLEAPAPHEGVDLTPRLAGDVSADRDLPAFCQTDLEERQPRLARASFGLRLPPWKYIESPRIDLAEVYDLEQDPAEVVNLLDARRDVADRMAAALGDWMRATERAHPEPEKLTPEALEVLRGLGYLH
jgi:arylsulfatase A-like enzyme